jgi:cysteinyl-tRNA synthetase
MNKRDSNNFKTAQTVSPYVARSFNALLGNLNDIKVKTKKRFEKLLDTIIEFIWKLTDHNV